MSTPWETIPAPQNDMRFLYGSATELNDVSAWSATGTAKEIKWRAFSDEENERLVEAWNDLNHEAKQAAINKRNKPVESKAELESENLQKGIGNPDIETPPTQVSVGIDSLFTVDLLSLECYPVFWNSAHLQVIPGKWFYFSTTTTNSCLPVENNLADRLEEAYHQVQPWNPSYSDELATAIALGAAAEEKLRVEIEEFGGDVIFQGFDCARLFSHALLSRTGKSLTGFFAHKQHTSGVIVFRGFDALQRYRNSQTQSPKKGNIGTPVSRPASPTKGTPLKPTEKGKDGAASAAARRLEDLFKANPSADSQVPAEELPREPDLQAGTADTMESAGPSVALPAELVEVCLVIHGIGQKLSEKYPSFSFVHAVNQLRTKSVQSLVKTRC